MPGYPTPRYTQVPNALLDIDIKNMSEAELKVTLVIIRDILGYHKDGPQPMSYSDLEKATGLSRQAVINGAKAAIKRERIKLSDKKGKRGSNMYEVNFLDVNEIDQSTKETSQLLTSLQNRPVPVNEIDRSEGPLKKVSKESEPQAKEKETPPNGGTVVNPDNKQPHVAIIEDGYLATMASLGRVVIEPKPIPRNAVIAAAIRDNEFTWQQVRDCVRWVYDPAGNGETQTYWQKRDDPIPLERVAKVISKWWTEHKPVEPVDFGTLAEWEAERDAAARTPEAIAARNAVLEEAGYAVPDES